MSVQWKLKVDRQMEPVRGTTSCQKRRRCPRWGGLEVVPPLMGAGMHPTGGEGQSACPPHSTGCSDSTQQPRWHLVMCPSAPAAEILLPSGFCKELWKRLY